MGADATIVQAAYAAAMANVPGDYGEIYKYKAEGNMEMMKSVTDFFETRKKEAEAQLQPFLDITEPSLQAAANDEAVGSDRLYDFLEGKYTDIQTRYETALKSKDKKLQRKLLGEATKLKNQYTKGAEALLTITKKIHAGEINEAQTGADSFLALKEITDFSNGNPNVNYSVDEKTNELIYEVTVPDPSSTDPDATKVIKIGVNDIEKLVVTKARDKETSLTTLNNTGKADGLKGLEYTDKDIKKIEYNISENILNNKNDYLDLIDRGLEGGVPFKKALGDALDDETGNLTYKELGAVLSKTKTPDTTDGDDKMVITDIGTPGINKEDFDVTDPIGKANRIALASVLTDGGNPLFAEHGYPAGKKLASRYYAEEVRGENEIGFKKYTPPRVNGSDTPPPSDPATDLQTFLASKKQIFTKYGTYVSPQALYGASQQIQNRLSGDIGDEWYESALSNNRYKLEDGQWYKQIPDDSKNGWSKKRKQTLNQVKADLSLLDYAHVLFPSTKKIDLSGLKGEVEESVEEEEEEVTEEASPKTIVEKLKTLKDEEVGTVSFGIGGSRQVKKIDGVWYENKGQYLGGWSPISNKLMKKVNKKYK